MKNFKRILALVLAAVLMFALVACNAAKPETTTTAAPETTAAEQTTEYKGEKVKVAAIKGPTGMGMVDMMDNSRYEITLTSDPTEVVSLIASGAVDIAACPLNLAANLFKKTGGNVQMLGINTLGVLYLLTKGTEINALSELKDKTIYATGQGATPEFIINYILENNGLKDSVKVEYLSEHSELATKLVSGEVDIAVLPEPFVTIAKSKDEKNIKSALSLTDEWAKIDSETMLSMGCVIARSDFINSNPDAVNQFIKDNKASVESVNVNAYSELSKMIDKGIIDASILKVDENLKDKQAEAAKQQRALETVSRCNIVFIDGEEMAKIANANFEVYFAADPTSVGGAVPSSDLYYAAK